MTKRNRNTILIVLGVLALLLLCCCFAFFALGILRAEGPLSWHLNGNDLPAIGLTRATDRYSRTLEVGGPTFVTISNEVGEVTVRVGDPGIVIIEAELEAQALNRNTAEDLLKRITIEATAEGSTATITADSPDGVMGSTPSVKMIVTVPDDARIRVQNSVGDVRLQGLEGEVQAEANVGNISYDGQLPRQGEINLRTDVGNVSLLLDADAAFRLDADTSVGHVDNEFAIDEDNGGDNDSNFIGERLAGTVGGGSEVTVTLKTSTGNIEINRR